MDHDDDGETSFNTFVDDVAFEPTHLQALLTAAGRNVATILIHLLHSNHITHSLGHCNFICVLSDVIIKTMNE